MKFLHSPRLYTGSPGSPLKWVIYDPRRRITAGRCICACALTRMGFLGCICVLRVHAQTHTQQLFFRDGLLRPQLCFIMCEFDIFVVDKGYTCGDCVYEFSCLMCSIFIVLLFECKYVLCTLIRSNVRCSREIIFVLAWNFHSIASWIDFLYWNSYIIYQKIVIRILIYKRIYFKEEYVISKRWIIKVRYHEGDIKFYKSIFIFEKNYVF